METSFTTTLARVAFATLELIHCAHAVSLGDYFGGAIAGASAVSHLWSILRSQ